MIRLNDHDRQRVDSPLVNPGVPLCLHEPSKNQPVPAVGARVTGGKKR